MEKNDKIRIGIVGTNFISDWLADASLTVPTSEITAVYSRKRETGEAFAAKHGISDIYTDFEAFVSSDIDAVYVASPNFAHCEQSVRAMEHGKHVLCEKVIASNGRQLDRMINTAKENGVLLMEAMRPIHDPYFGILKENLPRLGKLRRVSFEYCQYSSRYDCFKAGEILNAFDPSLSNAAVMDIGVYVIHLCAALFGRPEKIVSMSTFLSNGFEGAGHVLCDYGDMKAEISYSKITESAVPSFIMGEEGTLTFDKVSKPQKIELIPRNGEPEIVFYVPAENNMKYELADFAEMILTGKRDSRYLEASKIAVDIIDEIRRQNGIVFPADMEENRNGK